MHLNITDTSLLPLKQQQLENLLKKKEKENLQKMLLFSHHLSLYTIVWNDLQTLQLSEHSLTALMFSHILFNVML